MDLIQEIRYSGICKCCLENDNLKNLWSEYCNDGETEVYGQMMAECFVLPWHQPDDPENNEQICEDCVAKLRSAFYFKKQVLTTEEELMQQFLEVPIPKDEQEHTESNVKLECSSGDSSAEDVQTEVPVEYNYMVTYEYDPSKVKGEVACTESQVTSDHQYTQYQEIEYLEEDKEEKFTTDDTIQDPEVPKRKWPKKKKRAEILKPYLNYTQEDLKNSIEAVLSKKMTKAEAAEAFNVPRRTISGRIRRNLNGSESRDDEYKFLPVKAEEHYKLIEDVKKILTFTNATPFKTVSNIYYCGYCYANPPRFNDPEELRVHIRVQHINERVKGIDNFMRPQWKNEIVKVDIQNLICSVCCFMIPNWEEMFTHLKEYHDVEFRVAKDKVVPYTLGTVLNSHIECALCKEKYPNFNGLESHMNSHYGSYVCVDCGDLFATEVKLNSHVKIHSTKKFLCSVCGKKFTREMYRWKHFNYVHVKGRKYKCLYCDERFSEEAKRHKHVLENHKEKAQHWTCELCGKTFDWKSKYMIHLRKRHKNNKIRQFQCKFCDQVFCTKELKDEHQKTHKIVNICLLCKKTYSSAQYLKHHYLTVHAIDPIEPSQNDTSKAVEDCKETSE